MDYPLLLKLVGLNVSIYLLLGFNGHGMTPTMDPEKRQLVVDLVKGFKA